MNEKLKKAVSYKASYELLGGSSAAIKLMSIRPSYHRKEGSGDLFCRFDVSLGNLPDGMREFAITALMNSKTIHVENQQDGSMYFAYEKEVPSQFISNSNAGKMLRKNMEDNFRKLIHFNLDATASKISESLASYENPSMVSHPLVAVPVNKDSVMSSILNKISNVFSSEKNSGYSP